MTQLLELMVMVASARVSARRAAVAMGMRYQTVWALMHRVRAAIAQLPVVLTEEITALRLVFKRRGTRSDPSALVPGRVGMLMATPMLVGQNGNFVVRYGRHGEACLERLALEVANRPASALRRASSWRELWPKHLVHSLLISVHRTVSRRWVDRYLAALSVIHATKGVEEPLGRALVASGRRPWPAIAGPPPGPRCVHVFDTYPRFSVC